MGGYTRLQPPEDRHLYTKSFFEDMLAMIMGGHAAEVLVFGEMSTGPSNDIQQATETARRMVTQYGMSPKLGPRAFGRREELVFPGVATSPSSATIASALPRTLTTRFPHLIDDAHRRAMDILSRHHDLLGQACPSG